MFFAAFCSLSRGRRLKTAPITTPGSLQPRQMPRTQQRRRPGVSLYPGAFRLGESEEYPCLSSNPFLGRSMMGHVPMGL
jgi:hypothetical protein